MLNFVARNSTATHLLRAGTDINTIRARLGHVSVATTNVYAQIDLEMKAREHWHAWIGDATIADAILDRLLSRSHRLSLKGESLRPRRAAGTTTDPAPGEPGANTVDAA